MRRYPSWLFLLSMLAGCSGPVQPGPGTDPVDHAIEEASSGLDAVPLISRDVLFSNPTRVAPQLSPDGTRMAFLAPDEGVLNVWVRTLGAEDDRVVTSDRGRGIRSYRWAQNGEFIVYIQDSDGDENWHIYAVPSTGGEAVDLTPIEGVQARIAGSEPAFPDEILISMNDRVAELHDVYRVDVRTGERTLVMQNDLGALGFTTDHELRPRIAWVPTPDGGYQAMLHNADDGSWADLFAVPAEDSLTTQDAGFAGDNRTLYLISSVGANAGELRLYDVTTGESEVALSDPHYDVSGVMLHPTTFDLQAASVVRERVEWTVFSPEVQGDFEVLAGLHDGEFAIVDRDLADENWLVVYYQDVGPAVYYHYERTSQTGNYLFAARPELEGQPLVPMTPMEFPSRDGLTIHGYLTRPPVPTDEPVAMVLLVHGGPWGRDVWGYSSMAQWLANRGYAVLQVNFRGSTGYGKDFVNAGDRQWGLSMQDDLTDAVGWAIDRGVADPARICIMGGSYGGYATLMGLTKTPELFACGVDIVGPSSLITLLNSIPPYWEPIRAVFNRRVGHPEEDAEFLRSVSPLHQVERIRSPLLIGQGANDPRVAQAESDQIVEAMQLRGTPVTYVLYGDEGHGFARPENRISFFAVTEAFLAAHLGGRYEPIGDAFEGSSIEVLAGTDVVPGLAEAMGGH